MKKLKHHKMKKSKWMLQSFVVALLVFGFTSVSAQIKTIETEIFKVVYDEGLEQPVRLEYRVQCPLGDASRSGLDFRKYDGVHTSDNDDYSNNVYDKGHLAPAAAFNCDREMVRSTFSYLNCALQHEGLNRGPWKELERFERDLAKLYTVDVVIEVVFEETLDGYNRVPGGAAIPSGFEKTIYFEGNEYTFYFPNQDVAGQDWFNFLKFKN